MSSLQKWKISKLCHSTWKRKLIAFDLSRYRMSERENLPGALVIEKNKQINCNWRTLECQKSQKCQVVFIFFSALNAKLEKIQTALELTEGRKWYQQNYSEIEGKSLKVVKVLALNVKSKLICRQRKTLSWKKN